MSQPLRVSKETVDKHFIGIMITVQDPFIGPHQVPGWQCRHCGWRVGTQELPPPHVCQGADADAIFSALLDSTY